MNAANQLLQQGGRLDDLHFTSPIVMLGRFSPPAAHQPVVPTDARLEPKQRAKVTARPWWRFW
jgi:hypothetical protein